MILHGNRRGGAKDLAQHLLKDENEHVDVYELRGFMSEDLTSALNEAYTISKATKAKKFLYSLSLNPPEGEKVSTKVFLKAIGQVEKKLKMVDQPRAIVFHEKKGRRHCHVVWSRINTKTMTAIHTSNDWHKLKDVSRRLFVEHGWDMPKGLIDRNNRDPKNFTMAQWQQAKRIGKMPQKIRQDLEESWSLSFDKRSFEDALKDRGYWLAKGDRAGFVVLDHRCEIFALGTKWMGIKVKDIRARLGDESKLRSVEQARVNIAADMRKKLADLQKHQTSVIAQRRAVIEDLRKKLVARQKQERKVLKAAHAKRWEAETIKRQARFNKGFKGLVDRFTGKHTRIKKRNERETLAATQCDQQEKDQLIFTHLEQRQSLNSRMQRLETFGQTKGQDISHDISQYSEISQKKRDVFDYIRSDKDGGKRKPGLGL